ncbi:MAG: CopG family transcriptional regulator [Moorea sp. SIO3C2]|uniref:CopG family transcriptional regulator n=1 Tax=Moorena sp. SIO4E2 TaxID=2607826 RepID=UPI0013B79679|nr:CopG family transcriptional regulator [Moorena sp. SIO4E2]NEP53210.1 CopG family transcriptional regulator [Moorena sp. SIO3C2]NEQ04737.1 CopG family transcriptional regulator [Moorena sp. SIO4E2]
MKDERLMIRINKLKKMQLKQEAERRGMTPSELVRSLIAKFYEPKQRDTAG